MSPVTEKRKDVELDKGQQYTPQCTAEMRVIKEDDKSNKESSGTHQYPAGYR